MKIDWPPVFLFLVTFAIFSLGSYLFFGWLFVRAVAAEANAGEMLSATGPVAAQLGFTIIGSAFGFVVGLVGAVVWSIRRRGRATSASYGTS